MYECRVSYTPVMYSSLRWPLERALCAENSASPSCGRARGLKEPLTMQDVHKKAIKKCHSHRKEKGRQALVLLHHEYPYHCFCYLVFPHRKHRDYSRILYYIVCVLYLLVQVILSAISGHLRHCLLLHSSTHTSPTYSGL